MMRSIVLRSFKTLNSWFEVRSCLASFSSLPKMIHKPVQKRVTEPNIDREMAHPKISDNWATIALDVTVPRIPATTNIPLTTGSSFGRNQRMNNGPTVVNKIMNPKAWHARRAKTKRKLSGIRNVNMGADPMSAPRVILVFSPITVINKLDGIPKIVCTTNTILIRRPAVAWLIARSSIINGVIGPVTIQLSPNEKVNNTIRLAPIKR